MNLSHVKKNVYFYCQRTIPLKSEHAISELNDPAFSDDQIDEVQLIQEASKTWQNAVGLEDEIDDPIMMDEPLTPVSNVLPTPTHTQVEANPLVNDARRSVGVSVSE